MELRFFQPEKLRRYFPSLDGAAAEQAFAEDVNMPKAALRPRRTSPVRLSLWRAQLSPLSPELRGEGPGVRGLEHRDPSLRASSPMSSGERGEFTRTLLAADRAEEKGNFVRAAFCLTKASATN